MAEITAATAVAKVLKEEGVEWYAGVHGGHIWPLLTAVAKVGIKMYHMRHEQSGVYMADGWARATGKPGVCFGTAGPGFANMISGIYQAYLARSPLICLFGQHNINEDGWGPFQEGYAEPVASNFTKWTRRVVDPSMVAYYMQKAFRDATSYPPGPVGIEIPRDVLVAIAGDENHLRGYLPKELRANPSQPAGDPQMVEKSVRMLLEAKKPTIVAGDGVFWSKASDELKEFVELLSIPVITRRMGRGAVPEEHPLAFGGGFRRPIQMQSDVVAIFGLRMNMLEGFGLPPRFPVENVKYIQVSEDMEELTTRLPTEVSIFGSPKQVLRQMIDCAKDLMKSKPDRSDWVAVIAKEKAASLLKTKQAVDKVRNNKPIHPDFAASELVDFLDKDATLILDSFSLAGFMTDKIKATFAGQIMDGATWSGVGHGVGIAIGAQLGRPGKQVVDLLGDGGLGIAGWDIETAARYKIPACYFLFNNSGWMGNPIQKVILPDVKDSWGMLPDIRYDKIFAEMGCHTELVAEPQHLRPALERAFSSGKTSVINVIPDDSIPAPQQAVR
ncbi:MAG: thiamine pyrophosphate-binding protein, partial [Dehalococcoidales bacterium]|nr:thiamine pyrophosphate-binding protein [Dehalococcoidales bacterium]